MNSCGKMGDVGSRVLRHDYDAIYVLRCRTATPLEISERADAKIGGGFLLCHDRPRTHSDFVGDEGLVDFELRQLPEIGSAPLRNVDADVLNAQSHYSVGCREKKMCPSFSPS